MAGRLAARLQANGIDTPLRLRDADPAWLRERVGVVMERMCRELRGVPCHGLTLATPGNKSILASRSFGRPVTSRQELTEAVSMDVAHAAEKLRRQQLTAGVVMVFVTTNQFRKDQQQYAASRTIGLPVPTADTTVLLKSALLALDRLWRDGFQCKKAGVTLLELGPEAEFQTNLWTAPDSPRSRTLMRTIDGSTLPGVATRSLSPAAASNAAGACAPSSAHRATRRAGMNC